MLSSRIREARRAKGLTQAQVADALHIKQATYSGYETGKRQPTPVTISKIAALLGVTGNYLLGLDTDKKEEELAKDRQVPPRYDELDDAGKALINSLIDKILEGKSVD